MGDLRARLEGGVWGLLRARSIAAEMVRGSAETRPAKARKAEARALICFLFDEDVDLRKRAADVARRITDRNVKILEAFADEIAGLLEVLPPSEARTRWHLGLVVPRIAHTRAQRLRAARMMLVLAEDESNVVRCSAVEGLALLASTEPSLRDDAEEMIANFLHSGTAAMKCRARHAQKLRSKAHG